ncbi:MAG: histidinol dehydrogenase [Flavobacteriaceae bacterium]|nr:MAG: histidinol dehydrogenase [Flavobacteriaceae bacterium]
MEIIKYPAKETWNVLLQRATQSVADIEDIVAEVFENVKVKKDKAVCSYTHRFDKVQLDDMFVSQDEFEESISVLSQELKEAIRLAKRNIEKFHRAQDIQGERITTSKGVFCWQEKRAITNVGLYIPGGSAPLFSTVLMLVCPAKIAGCKNIVLCSPPNKEGKIHPAILYTAQLCGVSNVLKVGGIQAIAGMTFGTESIPKVSKIFGPGNQYVTVAKQLATKYGVAIDMPAGPSELLVVADESANPAFVASDLLSQAEHGVDSQVICVSTSVEVLEKISVEVYAQLEKLPRKEIAKKSIENSKLILVSNDLIALELINAYGPEHFIICTENNNFYCQGIENAGSVFLGNYTPESAGDYASGTNHTLPTNGHTKAYSGVNLNSFQKTISFQKISEKGIQGIGPAIEIMAEAEGLFAHKNAVTLRLNSLKNKK